MYFIWPIHLVAKLEIESWAVVSHQNHLVELVKIQVPCNSPPLGPGVSPILEIKGGHFGNCWLRVLTLLVVLLPLVHTVGESWKAVSDNTVETATFLMLLPRKIFWAGRLNLRVSWNCWLNSNYCINYVGINCQCLQYIQIQISEKAISLISLVTNNVNLCNITYRVQYWFTSVPQFYMSFEIEMKVGCL